MQLQLKRHYSALLASLLLSASTMAEDAEGIVQVEVAGLSEARGSIYFAVYDNGSDWLGDNALLTREVVIADSRDGGMVRAELVLPPGRYAFSVFHDENGNGKLDTNFIGIPKEPIAVSNNAKAKFGPPKFEDAVFSLDLEPLQQRIHMESL